MKNRYKPKFFQFQFHPDREFSWAIQSSFGRGFALRRPLRWSYKLKSYYWGWWRIEFKYRVALSLEKI